MVGDASLEQRLDATLLVVTHDDDVGRHLLPYPGALNLDSDLLTGLKTGDVYLGDRG